MVTGLDPEVALWWALLSLAGVVNVGLWLKVGSQLQAVPDAAEVGLGRYRHWQWILAGGFVLGCASRSWIIRADVQRIAMIDSPLASVAVGRAIATLAETMFVAQWALFLNRLARQTGSRLALVLSWLLVPMILVAETCSWTAVLTTNYLGNVFEESLWGVTGTLFTLGLVVTWRKVGRLARPFVTAAITLGLLYVLFMVTVDVPMYITRWQADELAGKAYLDLAEGLRDVTRVVPTGSFGDWKDEMPWMSLYFTAAVWMSLALVLRPVFSRDDQPSSN